MKTQIEDTFQMLQDYAKNTATCVYSMTTQFGSVYVTVYKKRGPVTTSFSVNQTTSKLFISLYDALNK